MLRIYDVGNRNPSGSAAGCCAGSWRVTALACKAARGPAHPTHHVVTGQQCYDARSLWTAARIASCWCKKHPFSGCGATKIHLKYKVDFSEFPPRLFTAGRTPAGTGLDLMWVNISNLLITLCY
jgi:hypothetical protein